MCRNRLPAVAETLLFNALREAIDEEMARDPHVCVMGEDVGQYGGSYKVTKDLYEKYGELRVLDFAGDRAGEVAISPPKSRPPLNFFLPGLGGTLGWRFLGRLLFCATRFFPFSH